MMDFFPEGFKITIAKQAKDLSTCRSRAAYQFKLDSQVLWWGKWQRKLIWLSFSKPTYDVNRKLSGRTVFVCECVFLCIIASPWQCEPALAVQDWPAWPGSEHSGRSQTRPPPPADHHPACMVRQETTLLLTVSCHGNLEHLMTKNWLIDAHSSNYLAYQWGSYRVGGQGSSPIPSQSLQPPPQ